MSNAADMTALSKQARARLLRGKKERDRVVLLQFLDNIRAEAELGKNELLVSGVSVGADADVYETLRRRGFKVLLNPVIRTCCVTWPVDSPPTDADTLHE